MPGAASRFRVNGYLVDPALNRVTVGDHTVQVEPKIMDVLVALAERPGEVVTRGELMERVWPGVFVTDDALNRAIRELRRLFSDEAEQSQLIETIRKRGYRLLASVERDSAAIASSSTAEVPPSRQASPETSSSWAPGPLSMLLIVVAALVAGAAGARLSFRRPDAGELQVRFAPFTSTPGNEVQPALSAAGRLAFVARGADERAHIFLKRIEDASAMQLTRGEAREVVPTWSPDGRLIAFARLTVDPASAEHCEIWIAEVNSSGSERRIAPCVSADDLKMSWSPDGTSLALAAGEGSIAAPLHIELLSIASGARHAVTTPPEGHIGDAFPAFSPDGTKLAFIRSITGSIGDIFVVPVNMVAGTDTAKGEPRRITFDNADVLGVDWEPDGQHLVFSSERGGGISLWRVALSGGEPALLAGGGAKLKHPSVSRGDGSIAYEDWHYEINLAERPAAEAAAPNIPISPTSDQWNFDPQLSPDGKRLAFQSTRSGRYELWAADRDGSHAQQLTHSAIFKSMPRWSADSRQIVFSSRSSSGVEADVIDVDSRATRVIARDRTAIIAPSWSHDGRHLYFGSRRNGSWQIWQVGSEGGEPRQVTTTGGYAALESLDGRWLYYTSLVKRGLWRRPVDGKLDRKRDDNDEMLVNEDVQADDWANFGVLDGGFFFIVRPDDGDPVVAVVEEGSHEPRLGTRLPDFGWSGIAMSRDGARVLYAHADRHESNITLLQFDKRSR